VIPVINEIGGGSNARRDSQDRGDRVAEPASTNTFKLEQLSPKTFQPPQIPDTDEIDPIVRAENRGY